MSDWAQHTPKPQTIDTDAPHIPPPTNWDYIYNVNPAIDNTIDPRYIQRQRELGWPDIHPEDYCHKCGNKNPLWYVEREEWIFATQSWAERTGREGICCPTCFAEMFNAAGRPGKWIMKVTMERLDKPETKIF